MFEQVEVNSERWFDLTPLINEEFRDIEGFEGYYQISNYGRIKSLERQIIQFNGYKNCTKTVLTKILKCSYDKDGYLIVTLHKDKKGHWKKIHQIMGVVFFNNNGQYIINHKDLNKKNPRIDNLELCTNIENREHAKINGAVRKGQKVGKFDNSSNLLKIYRDAKECAISENYTYNQIRYYINKKVIKNGYQYDFIRYDKKTI